jgi:type III pantothenate kinase
MRIITVDNGNSNPHVGIFQNEKLVEVVPLKNFISLPDDFILISNVGKEIHIKPSIDLNSKKKNKLFFDMAVNYTETLGDDRLFSAYYIFKQLKPNEKTLSIDCGTFMTVDLIDHSGFAGGYIFPGINSFLAIYQKGSNLPTLNLANDFELKEIPHSTDEAILGAVELYLEAVLEKIIKKTSPSKIVITGGSLEFIKNKLLKLNLPKVEIETCPHLLHSSLLSIYQTHLRSTKI